MLIHRPSGLSDRRIWIPCVLLGMIAATILAARLFGGTTGQENRPALMVMSSIPLQWGGATMADIANGKAEPSPLFDALTAHNIVTSLDDLQRLGAPGKVPLLLVQPRALAPTELVQLDAWVRKGGVAIIFADPALDWPSDLPLGDQRRPLFTSLLNPLFRHWGVELALPVREEDAAVNSSAGGYKLALKSPGIWVLPQKAKATALCKIRKDEQMALCTVGKGRALLIADADLLHETQWTGGMLTSGTMTWLQQIITASRSRHAFPDSLWESQDK